MNQNLAIILCSYNGAPFLQDQLDSFAQQSIKTWELFVYDDASSDNTKEIVERFSKSTANKVNFTVNQPRLGFAKNFLHGISATPRDFDFYSLSDQDDIWRESKLARAIEKLNTLDQSKPALFCSRSTLIDQDGKIIGHSPLFPRQPSFNNALVQSIAGGNTMVFNNAAKDLIEKAGWNLDVISHDWFIYQLITGAGGSVFYDTHSELLYRQHGSNLIGSNTSLFAKLSRLKMLLGGSFKQWNDRNCSVLQNNAALLTVDNRNKLNLFMRVRESSFLPRIIGFIRCGVYRQRSLDNIALFFAGVLNRL